MAELEPPAIILQKRLSNTQMYRGWWFLSSDDNMPHMKACANESKAMTAII